MKKYNITVNGTSYEVVVEEVTDGAVSAPVMAPVAPKAAPVAFLGTMSTAIRPATMQ